MQYIINVPGDGDEWSIYSAPVPKDDAAYLKRVISTLRPLSDDNYLNGPAFILNTLAKYSYILDDRNVYWCVQWAPGLIVVRFSPDGKMEWSAIRSPVPNFGGREADEAEWNEYDEDAVNPQYHLIFDPWDAQFDSQKREWKSFALADKCAIDRFNAALEHVNGFGESIEQRDSTASDARRERCLQNLKKWTGDGIRLK